MISLSLQINYYSTDRTRLLLWLDIKDPHTNNRKILLPIEQCFTCILCFSFFALNSFFGFEVFEEKDKISYVLYFKAESSCGLPCSIKPKRCYSKNIERKKHFRCSKYVKLFV